MINYRKKILYYSMLGITSGGSDHSLFYNIFNLDKTKFEPMVIYRDKKYFVLKLQEMNIITAKNNFLAYRHYCQANKNYFLHRILQLIPGSKTVFYSILSFFEIAFLVNFILKKKIDILHLNHGINFDRRGIVAGILTRKKIIAHNRGLSKIKKVDIYLSKFIEKVICISDYTKQEYVNSGIDSNKCLTIYNGVDLSRFSSKKITENNVSLVGSVGRLEEWKGNHIFLKAISYVIKVSHDTKFLIVGKGSQKNNLIKLANDLGISEHLTFYDEVEKIEEIFNRLDIFVHASIQPEPFGRVIIEAMAMELPVISTDIGGPKEIIINNIDGFLIPPRDPKILAEKIIFLIQNAELRKIIGKKALETIKKRFDIKITVQKIENIY